MAPLFLLCILSLFLTKDCFAQSAYYEENFNDGNISDWEQFGNGWTLEQTASGFEYVGNTIPGGSIYSYLKNTTWNDSIFEVEIMNSFGIDKILLFKLDPVTFDCYALNIRSSYDLGRGNDVYLYKTNLITGIKYYLVREGEILFENHIDQKYSVKITTINHDTFTQIKVAINDIDKITVIDNINPLRLGTIGLYVYPSGIGAISHFDNISVTKLLSVNTLKQTDPNWSSLTYDHAERWSNNDLTIGSWGCALTSAVMILNYFGFNTTVPELNSWLVEEEDGYLRNGLLNWLAISRYSKINSGIDRPKLQYYQTSYPNIIKEGVENNIPSILSLPGHFVVTKGLNNSYYFINDPYYSTETINKNQNNLIIGQYQPSNTDLSYIQIVTNAPLSFSENYGFLKHDNVFIENTNNNTLSLSATDIYTLAKPTSSNFTFEISNHSGSYYIDVYLYDKEGNFQLKTVEGFSTSVFARQVYILNFFTKELNYVCNSTIFAEKLNAIISNSNQKNIGYYHSLLVRIHIFEKILDNTSIKNALKYIYNIEREISTKKFIESPLKNEMTQCLNEIINTYNN